MTSVDVRRGADCSPRQRVTKSLLGYGVLAGAVYVIGSVLQGLLTPGFSFARDSWSHLSLGPAGWVHVLVLVLTGLMVVAAAIGFRRHLESRGRAAWAWLAGYGVLLVVAGLALPDRASGPGTVHGLVHLAAGGLGFVAFAVACFLLAARFGASGATRLRWSGIGAGALLLVTFVALAATAGASAAVVAFTIGVVASWAWLAAASVHLYAEAAEIGRREAAAQG